MELARFDNTYARLPERFYARLDPTPVKAPRLLKLNGELAGDLGLDAETLATGEGLQMLAGNLVPEGAEPLAMAYAGQQFGNWSPQLGDGRAHLLGEVVAPDGRRFDLQLKGSGQTPFSRMGDGRAWIGPVLREYIVSEAMHALGVPTTRALAAVETGETIAREEFLPGAILTRVSRSHIRVGTFQYFAIRQDEDGLRTLADYAIDRLYPQCRQQKNPYAALLEAVVKAQAGLVAQWMGLGFVHGVMNTDNVSIAGETIDYGPCAFLDAFIPDKVFSFIDENGRYAFNNQPRVAHWNLVQFAQALLPLMADTPEAGVAVAQDIVNAFPQRYEARWLAIRCAKLGLTDPMESDGVLFDDLLAMMAGAAVDFTLAFRHLSQPGPDDFLALFDNDGDARTWLERWRDRLSGAHASADDLSLRMKKVNPALIARNHRVEEAISAARTGDLQPFEELTTALASPFDYDGGLCAPPEPSEQVAHTFCGT